MQTFQTYDDVAEHLDHRAAALLDEFGISDSYFLSFYDCLSHIARERFDVPYADGETFVLKRSFGTDIRLALSTSELTIEQFANADPSGCPYIPILELVDRFGVKATMGILLRLHGPFSEPNVILYASERTLPVDPAEMLIVVGEFVAQMFALMTDSKPSRRRDFKKKRGQVIATPRRMADFIQKALAIAGWSFSAKELAKRYEDTMLTVAFGKPV